MLAELFRKNVILDPNKHNKSVKSDVIIHAGSWFAVPNSTLLTTDLCFGVYTI